MSLENNILNIIKNAKEMSATFLDSLEKIGQEISEDIKKRNSKEETKFIDIDIEEAVSAGRATFIHEDIVYAIINNPTNIVGSDQKIYRARRMGDNAECHFISGTTVKVKK